MIWLIGSAVIGVIAGWLAGRLMRGNGLGLLGNILVGVLGAVGGGYVLGLAGVDFSGGAGQWVAAAIGAAAVLFVVLLFTGRRHGRRVWS